MVELSAMSGFAASSRGGSDSLHVGDCLIYIGFAYYSPMGGERASTTRMRLSDQICCACKVSLPPEPNQRPGERYCTRCAPRHRVLMQFMLAKDGWTVSFLEGDCKTSLPRHFIFQSELKILDLARHSGSLQAAGIRAGD
jgi:hypothetical protein